MLIDPNNRFVIKFDYEYYGLVIKIYLTTYLFYKLINFRETIQ